MLTPKNKKIPVQDDASEALPQTDGLPLFFTKPVVVNPERHGQAGLHASQDISFARKTNSIPLTAAEFMEAAKYYPIAFTGKDPIIPIALVGLEQENYFVEANGKWKENVYIPAYVRKYPFIFLEVPDSGKLTLCIDEASAQFTDRVKDGDIKLYEKNEPTTFTRNALTFCAAVQEQHALTHQFCNRLKELDLLTPNRSDAKLVTGRTISLAGFQVIDQQKLAKLPDETIAELHKQGVLPLIYYNLLSTSNWQRLVDMAAGRERKH